MTGVVTGDDGCHVSGVHDIDTDHSCRMMVSIASQRTPSPLKSIELVFMVMFWFWQVLGVGTLYGDVGAGDVDDKWRLDGMSFTEWLTLSPTNFITVHRRRLT